jgi:hypothetical protein
MEQLSMNRYCMKYCFGFVQYWKLIIGLFEYVDDLLLLGLLMYEDNSIEKNESADVKIGHNNWKIGPVS